MPDTLDPIEDSPEYLSRWSADVAAAVTSDELKKLVADYRRISRTANDPESRRIARRRAESLSEYV